ncbi:hypothetical protein BDBG_17848 [Blastomyces gilchristii SLH14081]|uniref:Uncharacterized protein n=1 Tax=Blastomyces gilchristii (strain SLH14081) TaxID=559298 RepID=A0A179UZQ3_BLAGS|nr:uncharacterized protein BDBG_17848 [Blastomyces gilchristii SLH14081]OAT13574.1 hypothetical protein BDBG_17848 [Blastomyces gilchristii SLH14081]
MKESKKGLEFSEMIEKMIMKFLYNEIYINYEMLHKILTDNDVNLVEEVVRHFALLAMQIQQHAVSIHSSFYLWYELHPRIPENALKKVRERIAVADTTETAFADAVETAVADAAVTAVADTVIVNIESRLKEISYAYTNANELLLN